MKTQRFLIYVAMACLSAMLFSGCKGKTKPGNTESTESINSTVLSQEQMVQRGSYLVTTGGCGDCHSPKQMGPKGPEEIQALMLSGHPSEAPLPKIDKSELQKGWILVTADLTTAVGPWGVSFSANITSDTTGIGTWPEENFVRALKQGKYKGVEGGRMLLPPMPWQSLAKLTEEDTKAIYAYLKSIKPVRNIVPAAIAPEDIK